MNRTEELKERIRHFESLKILHQNSEAFKQYRETKAELKGYLQAIDDFEIKLIDYLYEHTDFDVVTFKVKEIAKQLREGEKDKQK